MELEQRTNVSLAIAQMAEQYQMGQPLALHSRCVVWLRLHSLYIGIIRFGIIFAKIVLLILAVDVLYQYISWMYEHSTNLVGGISSAAYASDFPWGVIDPLTGIIVTALAWVHCLVVGNQWMREFSTSLLVCTEGIISIREKQVEVTRWDEVRGTLQGPDLGGRYTLSRLNRKPLIINKSFENVDDLADLIRQQLQKKGTMME